MPVLSRGQKWNKLAGVPSTPAIVVHIASGSGFGCSQK
jgi:hypothetical protein